MPAIIDGSAAGDRDSCFPSSGGPSSGTGSRGPGKGPGAPAGGPTGPTGPTGATAPGPAAEGAPSNRPRPALPAPGQGASKAPSTTAKSANGSLKRLNGRRVRVIVVFEPRPAPKAKAAKTAGDDAAKAAKKD